jgi:hypothetical protein
MDQAVRAETGAVSCARFIALCFSPWRAMISTNNRQALVIVLVFAFSSVALARDAASQRAVVPTGATLADQPSTGTVWPAPVGHRQPRAHDIPMQRPQRESDAEQEKLHKALDRKLIICRGCRPLGER